MKKLKISIMLNLATLCLALVVVVFGVYSLKQASMSVNGSLGFVAHNVKANIVTSIIGSVAEANATYSKTDVFKPSGDAGITLNGNTQNISFTRYFSDIGTVNNKPAPIKVSFAITNQSDFDIKVDVSTPTLPTGVTMTTDKSSIKIAQNASGNITATFYLDSESANFNATALTGLKLDLSQYSFKKSDIIVKYTETALQNGNGLLSNYYIKYGQGTVNTTPNVTKYDINWFIIGTYNKDTGEITKLSNNASDFLDSNSDNTYRMKEGITYAFMSDNILTSGGGTTDETKYVPFNNNIFYANVVDYSRSLEYPEVDSNDYSISTIRTYLNGKKIYTKSNETPATLNGNSGYNYTPKTTETSVNFFTQNTLKGDNATNDIYTLIQPRTLGDMYKKMSDSSTKIELPTAVEGILETDADAFWLLSYNEVETLLTASTNYTQRIGNILTPKTNDASTYIASAGYWRLRSPGMTGNTYNIEDLGYFQNLGGYWAGHGVRPAFLI